MEHNDDIIAVGLLIIPGANCVAEEFPVMFFWVWPLSSLDFMSDSVTSLKIFNASAVIVTVVMYM